MQISLHKQTKQDSTLIVEATTTTGGCDKPNSASFGDDKCTFASHNSIGKWLLLSCAPSNKGAGCQQQQSHQPVKRKRRASSSVHASLRCPRGEILFPRGAKYPLDPPAASNGLRPYVTAVAHVNNQRHKKRDMKLGKPTFFLLIIKKKENSICASPADDDDV